MMANQRYAKAKRKNSSPPNNTANNKGTSPGEKNKRRKRKKGEKEEKKEAVTRNKTITNRKLQTGKLTGKDKHTAKTENVPCIFI